MLNDQQKKIIVDAIKAAERNTSGEIKVHIEHHCPLPDVMDRAKEVFGTLNLQNTKLQTECIQTRQHIAAFGLFTQSV